MDEKLEPLPNWVMPPQPCSYIPVETASLVYRVTEEMPEEAYAQMMERGWRRHGRHFFRPACPVCRKCRSLRVVVDSFRPTKSQRRILRRNMDVQWKVQAASVTDAHIDIFNRYHADMHDRRGWTAHQVDKYDYFDGFLAGSREFAREVVFFRNDRLIAVGLIDIVGEFSSSVYFYHDPDLRSDGLGTFSMLCELQHVRDVGVTHHYLGYWIKECQSMAYKSRYGPHEILDEYVDDDEEPVWNRALSD